MVKNKIYNYIASELFKTFILILFSLSIIAWTVRSVNFLDLIVDSGYSTSTYFIYSFLNLTNVVTKFIPLSFLLALLFTIIKLERQNELIVLWTSGVAKLKITNLFLRLSVIVLLFYIFFSTLITPTALNISRNLIKDSGVDTASNFLKPNVFSDTFKGLTLYIGSKNDEKIEYIFIKDDGNNLNNILPEANESKDQTILARRGFVKENKIILENGIIQSYDQNNKIRIIQFNRTLLNFQNLDNRVIKELKIQETPTTKILGCLKKYYSGDLLDDIYIKNCPKNNIAVIIETFSRRLGMPFYIPVISVLISFLLIYKKNKKIKMYDRYIFFGLSFFLLVLSDLLVRFSGFSNIHFITYLSIPFILLPILYIILLNKLKRELK
tara:strand:+ start:1363 stop:2508 length:1146 start_codon:yes stop_codon:yes gene_type:complete